MRHRFCFFICATVFFFLMLPPLFAGNELFSLTATGPSERVKPGQQVRLRVTVTNTSKRKIGFIRSPGLTPEEGFRYEIEVRDEGGNYPPPSARVRKLDGQRTVTFESRYARWLAPGESFEDEVTVTDFYDLSRPGTYMIVLARNIPPAQDLGIGVIKSNSVAVVVSR